MSNLTNDIFLESVYDKYWDDYLVECETTKSHPSTSDFLIYLDENNLIPDMDYEND